LFQPRSWGGTTRHYEGVSFLLPEIMPPPTFEFLSNAKNLNNGGMVWVLRYFKFEQSEILKSPEFDVNNIKQ
jgi:hypothetical protein